MTDQAIEVLKEIRDELKATRVDLSGRIDQTNARLDQTNVRLDRVERRQAESEIRLATELVAVSAAIGDLKNVIIEDRQLRGQVADHEVRLKALEKKAS